MPKVEEVCEDLSEFIPNVEDSDNKDLGQGPKVSANNPDEIEDGD
jgi:hypothetical protein